MKPVLDLSLYAVLDPARSRGRGLAGLAAAAARGGATLMQLRMKQAPTNHFVAEARAVVAALAPFGVPLIINDRVDVALAAGAAGVHLGQEDMTAVDAGRVMGADAIVGVTLHHGHEAAGLPAGIADYAGLGPVFTTASKDPGDPPLGPNGLVRLIGEVHDRLPGLPVVGIAGIDHENAPAVIAAGADGVAVISEIFMADDPEAAARRLRQVVDEARRWRVA